MGWVGLGTQLKIGKKLLFLIPISIVEIKVIRSSIIIRVVSIQYLQNIIAFLVINLVPYSKPHNVLSVDNNSIVLKEYIYWKEFLQLV